MYTRFTRCVTRSGCHVNVSAITNSIQSWSDYYRLRVFPTLQEYSVEKATMVNYFIYAQDSSFSTFNYTHYETNGLKTVDQFKTDVEDIKKEQLLAGEPSTESKIVYLHWGDDCREVDEEKTRMAFLELRRERVNAEPEWIIRFLKEKYIVDANDKIKLLYIITHSTISNESVKKCIELNQDMHYEMVVFHAFNEEPENVDLSIAASFFKSRCIVYRNGELCDSADISKEFDYDKINDDNFAATKDQLKSYIKLKFINKHSWEIVSAREVSKLRKFRQRLFRELSSKQPVCQYFIEDLKVKERKKNMMTYDLEKFVRVSIAKFEMLHDVEKSIAVLMKYIKNNQKSYAFDVLKFVTKVDRSVKKEQISEVDFMDDPANNHYPGFFLLAVK